jgi:hypothetical protein
MKEVTGCNTVKGRNMMFYQPRTEPCCSRHCCLTSFHKTPGYFFVRLVSAPGSCMFNPTVKNGPPIPWRFCKWIIFMFVAAMMYSDSSTRVLYRACIHAQALIRNADPGAHPYMHVVGSVVYAEYSSLTKSTFEIQRSKIRAWRIA